MPTISGKDATLYYESYGEGPAIVFAHGAGGNAAVWFQQIPTFAERYRVIAFDHRGFGRSTCDEADLRSELFADDLRRILDDAGVDRTAIVSQSMGGWTALRSAVAHPDRVAGVVLGNTPGPVLLPEVVEAFAAIRQRVQETGGLAQLALAADFPRREPALAQLYAQLNAFNPQRPLPMDALQPGLTDAEIDGITAPIRMIATDGDQLFPSSVLQAVAARLGAKCVLIEEAGHSPYFERADRFNAAVEEFLTEIGW